jgi:hypothetical protein
MNTMVKLMEEAAQVLDFKPVRMRAGALPVPARLRGDREAFLSDLQRRRHQAQIAARHAVEGLTGIQVPSRGEPSVPLQRVS